MRWLMGLNVAGLIAGASYAGWVASPRWVPWPAIASTASFLVSLVVPFWVEYRNVRRGFRAVESSFLQKTRQPHFPGPRVQVFADRPPEPVFRKTRAPVRTVAALTVAGGLLLAADAILFLATPPPPGAAGGKITNF